MGWLTARGPWGVVGQANDRGAGARSVPEGVVPLWCCRPAVCWGSKPRWVRQTTDNSPFRVAERVTDERRG